MDLGLGNVQYGLKAPRAKNPFVSRIPAPYKDGGKLQHALFGTMGGDGLWGITWKGQNGLWYAQGNNGRVIKTGGRMDGLREVSDPNVKGRQAGSAPKITQEVGGQGNAGGSVAYGGGGSTGQALDTAKIASLNDYLRALDNDRQKAFEKAQATWETSMNEKNREKEEQMKAYQAKFIQFEQELGEALNESNVNTADGLAALQSQLGTLGIGGEEALRRQILTNANIQNRKLNADYARNKQAQEAEWNKYQAGYNDDIKKINDQRDFNRGEAEKTWGQLRKNTFNQIADVYGDSNMTAERQNYMNQANSLNDLITNSAFTNPSYKGQTRAMETAQLADLAANVGTYQTQVNDASGGAVQGSTMPRVRAVSVNEKDAGIKKQQEGQIGYGV